MQLEGRLLGGRYRIQQILGSGGMGAVYAAEQEDLHKQVAVKVLHADDLTPTDLARFKREALAAARLGHPNIVQVTDFQAWPGEPAVLVMEVLQGQSLYALLKAEGRLAPMRAVFIVTQLLAALAAAHAAGIVHRDIKPANIFLTRTSAMADLVKVLDFGIAKAPELAAGFVTAPGTILGTPAYMAPEQIRGRGGDHRIDIYAVGVCLFEMLAGRRPHQATTFSQLVAMLGAPPTLLRSVAPDIDPKLAEIVDRALSREPEDRPQSALAMLELLTPFGASERSAKPATPEAAPGTEAFTVGASDTRVSGPPVMPLPVGAPPRQSRQPPLQGARARIAPPAARVSSPAMRRGAPVPVDPALASASLHSLLWSIGGLVIICFPLGLVGIGMGMRARSIAARLAVPLPLQATIGMLVGVLSVVWSLGVSFFVLVISTSGPSGKGAGADPRIGALERRVGDRASSSDLRSDVACDLAQLHALRNGYRGTSGSQLSSLECRGKLETKRERASLTDVRLTFGSKSFDAYACYKHGSQWTVSELRETPCPE